MDHFPQTLLVQKFWLSIAEMTILIVYVIEQVVDFLIRFSDIKFAMYILGRNLEH